jgi:hypothetical protein
MCLSVISPSSVAIPVAIGGITIRFFNDNPFISMGSKSPAIFATSFIIDFELHIKELSFISHPSRLKTNDTVYIFPVTYVELSESLPFAKGGLRP